MIDGTFAWAKGIGPARERELRAKGILRWDDFPADGVVLAKVLDDRIRLGLPLVRRLAAEGRAGELVRMLPKRDHWRLYEMVEPRALFLDIETTATGQVTVIGVYDATRGPRLYVRGHNLGAFLDEEPAPALVTFNGIGFDVPVLRQTFPTWRAPPVHLDLRQVMRQLGERGGLKAIEERLGIGRPAHLKGVSGMDAILLWNEFRATRQAEPLRRLLEYNLYDVVQMRTLIEIACERMCVATGYPWTRTHRFMRGDVLYDLSRAIEEIVQHAARIEPDAIDEAERRTML